MQRSLDCTLHQAAVEASGVGVRMDCTLHWTAVETSGGGLHKAAVEASCGGEQECRDAIGWYRRVHHWVKPLKDQDMMYFLSMLCPLHAWQAWHE